MHKNNRAYGNGEWCSCNPLSTPHPTRVGVKLFLKAAFTVKKTNTNVFNNIMKFRNYFYLIMNNQRSKQQQQQFISLDSFAFAVVTMKLRGKTCDVFTSFWPHYLIDILQSFKISTKHKICVHNSTEIFSP